MIDREGGHVVEEPSEHLVSLAGQGSFRQSIVHQQHPPIADRPTNLKREVPRTKAGMTSLFDIVRRPAESGKLENLAGVAQRHGDHRLDTLVPGDRPYMNSPQPAMPPIPEQKISRTGESSERKEKSFVSWRISSSKTRCSEPLCELGQSIGFGLIGSSYLIAPIRIGTKDIHIVVDHIGVGIFLPPT